MDKFYSHFSQSTKNLQEVEAVAHDLSVQLLRIVRVLGTRWVASSQRTVKAVWSAHRPLFVFLYFDKGAEDQSRDSVQRATMRGIANRLCSKQFVEDLGLMYDVLEELSSLSVQLQSRDMTLERSDKSCQRTISVIQSFRDHPGLYCAEAISASNTGKFHGTELVDRPNQRSIVIKDFIDALVKFMKTRLFGSGIDPSPDDTPISTWETANLSDFNVLNSDDWPEDADVRYGEDQIRRLCQRFNLGLTECLAGMRTFVDSKGSDLPRELLPIKNLIHTFVVSTSECERSFNQMNLICVDTRTKLLGRNIAACLFINVNGPPLAELNISHYAKLFLNSGHRSADDTRSKKRGTERGLKYEYQKWLL